MKFKSFLRRTTATALAAGCLFSNITAYADNESTTSPMYLCKLTHTSAMYIDVTKEDIELRCVWYPIGAQSKLISTNNVYNRIFDKSQFFAEYRHVGEIMTTDGTHIGWTTQNIMIEAHSPNDVVVKVNLFNKLQDAEVTFNGVTYKY